ncbi:MAG TPA: tannase/feruloyl esterase family alpha/beta hydrolase [Burkholderiales bacterium]|nr:tannase/feruloyl esterase family alpha/beta hydrolase [Burkholderiales bacterium]
MQVTRRGSIGLVLALGLTAVSGASHAALSCANLATVTSEAATMTSAVVTPPGVVPGTPGTGNPPNNVSTGVTFCRVQGVARPSGDSEIKFEVWLPATAAAWTGRLKVNGTGGYAGATPYARLAQDIGDGFITAGSNMGHDGGENASWTLGHPEKVKDWGLRAHYYVATAAKTLSQAFYDQPVAHSYFEGCSNGGRQAMMMAQNYPELFDGIVAGAPSMFYPDILFWLIYTGKVLQPVLGQQALSATKRSLITQRVLDACDANDGLVDGQITNPRACTFDIDTLGPSGDNSLTAQELATVKAMYAGTRNEVTGELRYSGAKLGSEANFDPNFADNGGYGVFVGHYVYSTLDWTPANWRDKVNFSSIYDHTKAFISPVTAAPSPDIRTFTSRGGKIIHYHGWNDSVVPPDGSIAYLHALTQFERLQHLPKHAFDQQVEQLSPQVVAATAQAFGKRVQEYHRLFMLPAVSHCGGGTGPSSIGGGAPEPTAAFRNAEHHVVSAVIKWVEDGVAPEKIVATRFGTGNVVVRQRPVCQYPAQAAYNGSGDTNSADNFSCVTPKLQERTISATDILLIQNSLRQRDLKLPNR